MGTPVADNTKWEDSREIALKRDNRKCRNCDAESNIHVHHLIPRYLGGSDDPENLITLCSACHAQHHPTLQMALSKSIIEKWAIRLAQLLDFSNEIPQDMDKVRIALKLLSKDQFREGQLEIVLAALRNESMLVIRPTGSGKSLCYQVPGLIKQGTSYVFSPLKALMVDQSIGLHENTIPATFINSDLTLKEKASRYQLLEKKALKFLFLTPERFDPEKVRNGDEISRLKKMNPRYLVVDEAHCVDRWGNDFRPSYGRLAEVRTQLGNPPTLAFTATAGLKAQRRILESMGIPDAKVFISDIDRPNIALIRHEPKTKDERYRIIKRMVDKNNGKAMIFVPTVKIGREISQDLTRIGLQIPFYHGGMTAVDREFLLGRFTGRLKPDIDNIICTNAFGMGLDIPNIHLVIHWTQPESVEDYLQEFGRAGRDGQPSIALIFKSYNDTGVRYFMAKKTVQAAEKKGIDVRDALLAKKENIKELDRMIRNRRLCFRKQITGYFGEDNSLKRKSIAMRILEWILSKKKKETKSSICCDACDRKKINKLLTEDGKINFARKEGENMKFSISVDKNWKWKPKRWWIGLIVFWLFSTAGARLFGIEPRTADHILYIQLLTFLAVIFAAVTDREYSVIKRVVWVIVVPIVYEIIYALGAVFIGHPVFAAVVTSLFVAGCSMRRSKYFVEPVNEPAIEK